MANSTELGFTVGRSGIKVPRVEINSRTDAAWQVKRYFYRLWKANEPAEDAEYDRDESRFYRRELVVPPDAEKPIVVVREEYIPTSPDERESDRRSNVRSNNRDNSGGFGRVDASVVTIGNTEQSILLPPTEGTLEWNPLLTCKYPHKGGARVIDSSQWGNPSISFPGDEELFTEAIGPMWSHDYETQTTIFNKGVELVLRQFVELVGA